MRPTFRPTWMAVPVLAALLTACPGPAPDEPWLEVGSGEWKFERVDDRQEVDLVAGAQGGYHVWVSVLADGVDPGDAELEVETRLMDGDRRTSYSTVPVRLDSRGQDEGYEYIGWPAVQSTPACVAGRELLLRATLTDGRGKTAIDERIVVPQPNPATAPSGECDAGG